MHAPEPIGAMRVVADPAALDVAHWGPGTIVARIAADEALVIGATSVEVADEHAIVVEEAGFSGWWLEPEAVALVVARHADWALPIERPALAQGLLAGVPVKVWSGADRCLVLCPSAWVHELADRLR